jgi:ferredoxin
MIKLCVLCERCAFVRNIGNRVLLNRSTQIFSHIVPSVRRHISNFLSHRTFSTQAQKRKEHKESRKIMIKLCVLCERCAFVRTIGNRVLLNRYIPNFLSHRTFGTQAHLVAVERKAVSGYKMEAV